MEEETVITSTESSEVTEMQLDNTKIKETSNLSVRTTAEEQERLEKEIDETLDKMTDKDAARVVDEVVDLIKNIKKYTPAQKREINLAKMEKEYEELPEDSYKKKQLENKIYWLKKKMFPKLAEKKSTSKDTQDK